GSGAVITRFGLVGLGRGRRILGLVAPLYVAGVTALVAITGTARAVVAAVSVAVLAVAIFVAVVVGVVIVATVAFVHVAAAVVALAAGAAIAVVAVVVAAGAAAVVAIAVVAVVVALVAVAVALVAVVAPVAAVVALAAGATAVVALVVVSGVLWFRLSLDGHDRLFLTTSTVVDRDLDDVLAGFVENDRRGESAVAVSGGWRIHGSFVRRCVDHIDQQRRIGIEAT